MLKQLTHLCTIAALVFCTAATLHAQAPMEKPSQASPAETATTTIDGVKLTLNYCSPRVNGRTGKLFGTDGRISKDPHYPVWRGGANAATTLITDGDIKIGTVLVPKGTHTLFIDISDPENWKLIISNDTGEWGLSYNKSKDLGSTPMRMSAPPSMVENLLYTFRQTQSGRNILSLSWENHTASVVIAKP
jgi:hypothetical protein